jgi:hypothetical protein
MRVLGAAAALGLPALTLAQTPVSPSLTVSEGSGSTTQFQVNSNPTADQDFPAVAVDTDGDFIVTWESIGSDGGDTDSYSIQAQRYNSLGVPQGVQFQVNTYTTASQRFPAAAYDSSGDFAITWHSGGSFGDDSHGSSVQVRRFDASGTALGPETQVNSYTTNDQLWPDIALDSDGDFVVTWQSLGSQGDDSIGWSVQGQRFNSHGTSQGSGFQVNSYTTGNQFRPQVGMDASGDFAIVWESYGSPGGETSWSVQGQRYNASGTSQGDQIQLNSYTTSWQRYPDVAMDAEMVIS